MYDKTQGGTTAVASHRERTKVKVIYYREPRVCHATSIDSLVREVFVNFNSLYGATLSKSGAGCAVHVFAPSIGTSTVWYTLVSSPPPQKTEEHFKPKKSTFPAGCSDLPSTRIFFINNGFIRFPFQNISKTPQTRIQAATKNTPQGQKHMQLPSINNTDQKSRFIAHSSKGYNKKIKIK